MAACCGTLCGESGTRSAWRPTVNVSKSAMSWARTPFLTAQDPSLGPKIAFLRAPRCMAYVKVDFGFAAPFRTPKGGNLLRSDEKEIIIASSLIDRTLLPRGSIIGAVHSRSIYTYQGFPKDARF